MRRIIIYLLLIQGTYNGMIHHQAHIRLAAKGRGIRGVQGSRDE